MWFYVIFSLSIWAGVVSAVAQRGFYISFETLLTWLATGTFVAAISLGGRRGWVGRLVAAVALWTAALALTVVALGITPVPYEAIAVFAAGHFVLTLAGLLLGALLCYRPRPRRRRTGAPRAAQAPPAPAPPLRQMP